MGNLTFLWGRQKEVAPGRIQKTVTVTFSSSYATGGDTWQAADEEIAMPAIADLALLEIFLTEPMLAGKSVYLDKAGAKLILYGADGVQATNATDQTGVSVLCQLEFESFHMFNG